MVVATLMSTAEYHQIRTQLRTKSPQPRKKPEITTVPVAPGGPATGGGMQLYYDCLTAYNRLTALLGQKPNPAQAAVHDAWVRQARKDYELALLRYQAATLRP
jgi:hypothetical protein